MYLMIYDLSLIIFPYQVLALKKGLNARRARKIMRGVYRHTVSIILPQRNAADIILFSQRA